METKRYKNENVKEIQRCIEEEKDEQKKINRFLPQRNFFLCKSEVLNKKGYDIKNNTFLSFINLTKSRVKLLDLK